MTEFLSRIINDIRPLDEKAMAAARLRQDSLTKPRGSLGRLEELSIQIAGIQGKPQPRIMNKAIITMAADHGVVAEGVSAYPQAVTAQMVANFLNGGAGINVITRQIGARVVIVNMGVAAEISASSELIDRRIAPGTRNMCCNPAMTVSQAYKTLEAGIEIIEAEIKKGLDIVGTGDMGIGNTTASSAICAVITGKQVAEVTGRGTGLENSQLLHKIEVIEKAIRFNKPDPTNAIDILSKIGGFEIGGLAGVMLGGAAHGIPVVIDGFISGAAALIASTLEPRLKDYLIASHMSVEPGHQHMLNHLGLKPLMDLNLRLGEGTGAALGIFLAETSARILSEMATFGEAGVSDRS